MPKAVARLSSLACSDTVAQAIAWPEAATPRSKNNSSYMIIAWEFVKVMHAVVKTPRLAQDAMTVLRLRKKSEIGPSARHPIA